jgi:phosphoglycerol transferase MdoB-like AlkP superfamily enzyme
VPSDLILQSLWYGLKMDLSMATYLASVVCVFVLASIFFPFFRSKWVYIVYTGIILFFQVILVIADAEIFKAWGSRIDDTLLKYIDSPKEVWASISHLPLFWISAGLLLFYLLLLWGFRKIIRTIIPFLQKEKGKWLQTFLLIIFISLLIIPIRGGFQLSPLNQSSVYFSNNQFANNAAINASWNFMYSLVYFKQLNNNPYEYMKNEEAEKIVNHLFESDGKTEQVVKVTDSLKPNVIIIVWESFTEKVLNMQIDGKPVIKYFNELKKDGIYFSNCYSSGDRTDKGISAILSGYPALPKGSIVNFPQKTSTLAGLGNIFLKNNYSTSFYYGGESEFANIKSYISEQSFQKQITKKEFAAKDMNSKWGAHDDIVKNRILKDLTQSKAPFFTTWLTLSSHEPFETPVPSVFKGNDIQTKFLNSLHYSDSVIYSFISELKKMPLWNNTLVIISADHGHYLPITGKRADDYRIPVLWLGGALEKQNTIVDKTVSQLDIAGSLNDQFHFAQNTFRFSKNLFDSSTKHWTFFTYNDGIGFVTDSSRILFDNVGKRVVFEEGRVGKGQADIAKSLMQMVYIDFLKR